MELTPQNAKNLEELGSSLVIERQKILSILSDKRWFKNTDFEIQKKIFILPEDFDGYLASLATRRDEYKGIDVIRLLDVPRGNYNLISLFEVRSQKTNQVFTYEYVTSKYGSGVGYRGLIFLEIAGEIKYFILRQTDKFALGTSVFETIGGYVEFRSNKLLNIPKAIEDQINTELGLKEIVVKRFIDLGLLATDPAVTSSHIAIFAAIIDATNANLDKIQSKIYHTKPVNFQLIVEPIDRIREYVHKTDESFFLACVLRLISMGIIKI